LAILFVNKFLSVIYWLVLDSPYPAFGQEGIAYGLEDCSRFIFVVVNDWFSGPLEHSVDIFWPEMLKGNIRPGVIS
jgi:hypothetical protein